MRRESVRCAAVDRTSVRDARIDSPRGSAEGAAVTSDRASPVPMPAEDELVEAELARAQAKRRRGRARIFGIVVSVAVIGVVFAVVLPKIAGYRGGLGCRDD